MSCHAIAATPSTRGHRRAAIDAPLSTRRVPRAALPALLYGGAFLAKDLGALFDVHIPYVSDRAHGIAHGAHVGGTLACVSVHVFPERETMTISTPDVVRARL